MKFLMSVIHIFVPILSAVWGGGNPKEVKGQLTEDFGEQWRRIGRHGDGE